jgi:hypothetical protein
MYVLFRSIDLLPLSLSSHDGSDSTEKVSNVSNQTLDSPHYFHHNNLPRNSNEAIVDIDPAKGGSGNNDVNSILDKLINSILLFPNGIINELSLTNELHPMRTFFLLVKSLLLELEISGTLSILFGG